MRVPVWKTGAGEEQARPLFKHQGLMDARRSLGEAGQSPVLVDRDVPAALGGEPVPEKNPLSVHPGKVLEDIENEIAEKVRIGGRVAPKERIETTE
jgi:hypothetical protein